MTEVNTINVFYYHDSVVADVQKVAGEKYFYETDGINN